MKYNIRPIAFEYGDVAGDLQDRFTLSIEQIHDISPNEVTFFTGHNGSGKSTLLKCIAGHLSPLGGPCLLRDGRMDSDVYVAYVSQQPRENLSSDLTVGESLMVRRLIREFGQGGVAFLAADPRSAVQSASLGAWLHDNGFDSLLSGMGIDLSRRVVYLSGGQQQIVAILGGAYAGAEVIALDEPTSQVDEVCRHEIWRLLWNLARKGAAAVLCASHDREMVTAIGHRVIYLKEGRKVSDQHFTPAGVSTLTKPAVARIQDLDQEDRVVPLDWWETFFEGEDYCDGDDSRTGHLPTLPMNRAARTEREGLGILRLASRYNPGFPKNATIVDVPCGWGRHCFWLSSVKENKFTVVGVDRSREYLAKAGSQLQKMPNPRLRFVESDMRVVSRTGLGIPEGADLALNLWTSFGFFGHDDNVRSMEAVGSLLKSGGLLVLYLNFNPYRVKRGLPNKLVDRPLPSGGLVHVAERYVDEDGSLHGSWTVERTGRPSARRQYKIRVYDTEEFIEMGKAADLDLVDVLGGFEGDTAFSPERSPEAVYVFRKVGRPWTT